MTDNGDIFDPNEDYSVFTASQKREMIAGTIEGFIAQGYSASATLEIYRQHNLGIRTADFYDLWNVFNSDLTSAYRIQNVEPTGQVYEGILAESTRQLKGDYLFIAEVFYYDLTSDEMLKGHFFIDTDTLASKDRLEELLLAEARLHESYTGKRLVSANLIKGYRNPIQ